MKNVIFITVIMVLLSLQASAAQIGWLNVLAGDTQAIVQYIPCLSVNYQVKYGASPLNLSWTAQPGSNLPGWCIMDSRTNKTLAGDMREIALSGLTPGKMYYYNITYNNGAVRQGNFSTPVIRNASTWRVDGKSGTAHSISLFSEVVKLQQFYPQLQYSFNGKMQQVYAGLTIQGKGRFVNGSKPFRLAVSFEKDMRLQLANNQTSFGALQSGSITCWVQGAQPWTEKTDSLRVSYDKKSSKMNIAGGEDTICPFNITMPVRLLK